MSDERHSPTFNIGSQQGNVSNVAGDMSVHGGQEYVAAPADSIRKELVKLRAALANADLDPGLQGWVGELLGDAEEELDKGRPDAQKVAGLMERLTRLLKEAGAISVAGVGLIDPLHRIASWLGDFGQGILLLIR